MFDRFRQKLSWRLTRDTVLVAMVLGLLLNLVQITLDYFTARDAMERDVHALLEISQSPASQIAYNINVRLARELLDGLLEHPATIDARILDSDGQAMSSASQEGPDSDYRWISDALFGPTRVFSTDLSVPQLEDFALGRLQLTIDTYHYGTRFLERAGNTLAIGLLKSLALSVALLGIFYFVLTRPMMKVINALSQAQASSPEKVRLPIPSNHRQDEIGTMVGIVNQHLENMENSVARLRTAESAMKNYSSQLEREVADRTRQISEKNGELQLSNEALSRAKEDAVAKARARADFLASMSHEIRTPLNGLLGMLSIAVENSKDRGQRNNLAIALNAGQSLLGLLNDILDISKVEAGKLGLENIPFSPRALLQECLALHAQQARDKRIELIDDTSDNLPELCSGDPTRTRQILNNLLSNAIKFTNTGSVRLKSVWTGNALQVDVIDTGVGMSREGLGRIFSPFSQADRETTRLYGGTGLGLTLCRQLVERMHGTIHVESEEGAGTRFTVTLPLTVTNRDIAPPPDTDASVAKPSSGTAPERSLEILLVEDNHVNQLVASSMLKKLGHRVQVSENGARALTALTRCHYDLVLMDCQMPVMDGHRATRAIRSNPELSGLPVIAVTGNAMDGDREQCLASGMNDYITKPYNRDQLRAVINRWGYGTDT